MMRRAGQFNRKSRPFAMFALMIQNVWRLALLVTIASCAGCIDAPPAPAQSVPLPPQLLHLPGITGHFWMDDTFVAGIKNAQFPGEIQIYDWTGANRGLGALFNYDDNQKQAQLIADMITTRYRLDPQAPLFISSHSGGGAIAVWALEKLPPDVKVRDVLLLAPAISPTYDLSAALRHVSGHVHVFFSSGDALLLGLGTSIFGNMDRSKGDAAGMVGFTMPPQGDAAEYAKIVNHPYQGSWTWLGNHGDHVGVMSTDFVQQIVAPLLINDDQRLPAQR
jgi:hypothetical protein